MKRKYLSALLMGTLTVASMSTFTSCKDYDDDISNLQGQIDKLATADQLSQKVAELQALISSNKSDITSLQAELAKKTTLDEVKAVLADYATKQYVDAADKTLQDAIDALKTGDIAKLKEDVVKAQAAADKAAADAEKANADIVETLKTLATKTELQDAADAAQKAIGALESKNAEALKKAQAEILETLKGYATKSDVEDGDKKTLESLASTIKNASDALAQANANKQAIADALDILGKGYSKENTVAAAIEAIQGQIGTPNKELGTLDSRLAAIESVLNGVKDDDTKLGLATKVTNIENQLKDIIGEYTTMVTEVSLLGSYVDGGLTALGKTALQFTSGTVGKNITFGKAEKASANYQVPSAENQQTFVKGTTFNTKSELVVRVNPVNAVLTKTSIKLVDSRGNNLDNILEIGEPKPFDKLLTTTRAANNTGLWSIPVTVKAGVPASQIAQLTKDANGNEVKILYAVAVNNTSSEAAKDRYVTSTYDITVPKAKDFNTETASITGIGDVEIQSVNTMAAPIKLSDAISFANGTNATGTYGTEYIPAKSGEDITIDFTKNYSDVIQYFYVVRDDSNVDNNTSGSSAINAWKSYEYGGSAYGRVVEVNPAEKKPTLNIKINGQKGDKIGFRIFAIKYNGEVTPQYGSSFVVNVGEDESQASVAGDLLVKKDGANETGWLPLTGKLKDGVNLWQNSTTAPVVTNVFTADNGVKFTVEYSANGQNSNGITKNSDIKFVKFKTDAATDMTKWKDGSKANFTISQKNADGMVENQIAVSLTKKLPTAADAKKTYTWKDEQLVNGVYTAYVTPTGDVWTTAASANTTGYQKLTQAITGLNTDNSKTVGFHITIDGVKKENNKWVANDFTAYDSWKVSVVPELIDGKTQHKTTISYNWGKISSDNKDANGDYVLPLETVQTIFACPLTDAVQTYTWKQYRTNQKDSKGKYTVMADVNYLTYGDTNTVESYDENGNSEGHVNLLTYILGKNSYDNTVFGGTLYDLVNGVTGTTTFAAKYVTIEDVQLVSAVSGKQDYFIANCDGTKITFTKNSSSSNPAKDVKSYLKFTVVDAFGHKIKYSLDFTVKRAQ